MSTSRLAPAALLLAVLAGPASSACPGAARPGVLPEDWSAELSDPARALRVADGLAAYWSCRAAANSPADPCPGLLAHEAESGVPLSGDPGTWESRCAHAMHFARFRLEADAAPKAGGDFPACAYFFRSCPPQEEEHALKGDDASLKAACRLIADKIAAKDPDFCDARVAPYRNPKFGEWRWSHACRSSAQWVTGEAAACDEVAGALQASCLREAALTRARLSREPDECGPLGLESGLCRAVAGGARACAGIWEGVAAAYCAPSAGPDPDAAEWAERVIAPLWRYSQDLAEADDLDRATLVDAAFAQTAVFRVNVERRAEEQSYLVHNFEGRTVEVPYEEVAAELDRDYGALETAASRHRRDLTLKLEPVVRRHAAELSGVLRAVWRRAAASGAPAERIWKALLADPQYFGFRPEGVAVGTSILARARAQSLKFLRRELETSTAPAGVAVDTAAMAATGRALWLEAQDGISPTQFMISGELMSAAIARLSPPPDVRAPAAKDPARVRAAWETILDLTRRDVRKRHRWKPGLLGTALSPYAAVELAEALAAPRAPAGTPAPAPATAPRSRPLFEEVTSASGLQPPEWNDVLDAVSIGSAWLDYDGDGVLDVFARRGRLGGRLYRGLGGGRFEDATEKAGLGGLIGFGDRAVAADYDNDGRPDLFVVGTIGNGNHLFHNVGGGRFKEVTRAAGLSASPGLGVSALWFDYDGDGLPDLLVVHMGEYRDGVAPNAGDSTNGIGLRLYHNDGGGKFTDVTERAGLRDGRWGWAAQAVDLDGDGRPDIFACNIFGKSVFWRNRGDGTFEDRTAAAGFDAPSLCKGVSVADVNGDGKPDLYLSMIAQPQDTLTLLDPAFARNPIDPEAFSGGYWGKDRPLHDLLYVSRGDGTFKESYAEYFDTAAARGFAWNGFFVDYDLDGHQDLYVTNGFYPDVLFFQDERKALYHFDASKKRFSLEPRGSGADVLGVSRGSAFADFDGDGCPDLLVTGLHGLRALRGLCPDGNRGLKIKLEGVKSNRDGIGARVRVTAGGNVQTFWYGTEGGGSISSYAGQLLVGLGKSAAAERVEVFWPSGRTSVLTGVPAGGEVRVKEPEGAP